MINKPHNKHPFHHSLSMNFLIVSAYFCCFSPFSKSAKNSNFINSSQGFASLLISLELNSFTTEFTWQHMFNQTHEQIYDQGRTNIYTPIQSYKVYSLCTTENINCCLCPSLSCLNALAKALFYEQYDHMSDLNGQKHISTKLLVVD